MHFVEKQCEFLFGLVSVAGRNDDVFRKDAKRDRIEPGLAFALRGARAGWTLSIQSVGLQFSRSDFLSTSGNTRLSLFDPPAHCSFTADVSKLSVPKISRDPSRNDNIHEHPD